MLVASFFLPCGRRVDVTKGGIGYIACAQDGFLEGNEGGIEFREFPTWESILYCFTDDEPEVDLSETDYANEE